MAIRVSRTSLVYIYSIDVVRLPIHLGIFSIRYLLRFDPWTVRSGSGAHARIAIGIRV